VARLVKIGYTTMSRLIIVKVVVVLGAVFGMVGCAPTSEPSRLRLSMLSVTGQLRSVEQIARPSQVGKTVYVQGTVGDRIPLVNGLVYQVTDNTGTLWVVSNDNELDAGTQIVLRGKVAYEATPEFGDHIGEIYLWEINTYEPRGRTEDIQ